MWSDKLADAGRKRSRYQEMATEGLITFGELREHLTELEDTCEVVRGELDALAGRMERAEQLERDMETLLEQTAGVGPEDLDALTGDQRNEIYRMLRLEITPSGEGYAMRGVFRTVGLPPHRPTMGSRSHPISTAVSAQLIACTTIKITPLVTCPL